MARILDKQTGTLYPLAASTLLGSGPYGMIRVRREGVSEVHALLRWQGHRWVIKDLGSRNGTFVEGKRVAASSSMPLFEGDELAFGSQDCTWVLTDDGAPGILAERLSDGLLRSGEGGMLALPDPDEPLAMALRDRLGAWSWEQGGEVSALSQEPHTVVVDGVAWRLHTPVSHGGTQLEDPGWRLEEVALLIAAAPGAEHVRCWFVDNDGARRELPARPTPYQVLAVLGRAMVEDRAKSPSERGWRHRDFVLSELDTSPGNLDSWVFWCRRCATNAGVVNGQQIIERSNKGYLRLGVVDVVFDE